MPPRVCDADAASGLPARLGSLTAVTTRVLIRGTGLIGTSLGIALTRQGYAVTLADPSPTAERLARDLGAGELATEGDQTPDVIVVAAPPDVAADVVIDALATWPESVVTDVASVKGVVLDAARAAGADLTRYVGSHPMAGRERSGAGHARGDLFEGRAWVVVPSPESGASAVATVTDLARSVGSAVTVMDAQTHDEAVATISHLPQVAASLVAAQLRSLDEQALGLAGQGVRDVTRIAASDPRLWTQIIAGNAGSIREVLGRVHADLGELLDALAALADPDDAVGSLEVVNRTITHGNVGHARIPGKHGAGPAAYLPVTAIVPDTPGALARLLTDVGEAGVNLEDLRIDHGLGQPFGLAEIMVVPAAAEHLQQALEAKGWRVLD
ncbi:MAG: prephenate dehydrogenase [Actinomycetales bacterium]|nr:prephenate dehydrogenase [Candidatus Phosphoribacter baldrii]